MDLNNIAPLYVSENTINNHTYLLNRILDTAEILFFNKNDVVFYAAERINGLYVVLNGTLESFFYENGNYYTNRIIKQGSIAGTSSFLAGDRYTGLKCRTDAIVAYVSNDILINWDKNALLQLLSIQSQRNQHLINQITTLALYSSTKRLLLFLHEMARDNLSMGRKDIPVQISISNKDIASIINTSREHVTKMFRSLEKTMRIKVSGNKIVYYPVDIEKKLFWSV